MRLACKKLKVEIDDENRIIRFVDDVDKVLGEISSGE